MSKQSELAALWKQFHEAEKMLHELRNTNPYNFEVIRLEQRCEEIRGMIKHIAAIELKRFKKRLNKLRAKQDRKAALKREAVE